MAAKLIHVDRKSTFRGFAAHLKSLGCKNADIAFALSVSERQIEAWLWDADKEPGDFEFILMHAFVRALKGDVALPKEIANSISRIANRKICRCYRMAARLQLGKSAIGQPNRAGRPARVFESADHGGITAKQAAEISGQKLRNIQNRLRAGKTIDEAMQ